jgi:hypothetical protein
VRKVAFCARQDTRNSENLFLPPGLCRFQISSSFFLYYIGMRLLFFISLSCCDIILTMRPLVSESATGAYSFSRTLFCVLFAALKCPPRKTISLGVEGSRGVPGTNNARQAARTVVLDAQRSTNLFPANRSKIPVDVAANRAANQGIRFQRQATQARAVVKS